MKKKVAFFTSSLLFFHLTDKIDEYYNKNTNLKIDPINNEDRAKTTTTTKNTTPSDNLNLPKLNFPLQKLFEAEHYILQEPLKNQFHKSIPFNRKIKYIYNLPFYYCEYENYNFNKLSDLFLNIHIFIN